MRYGLIGTILLILVLAFILKNIYIGGLGGIIVLILIVLLLTGKL